VGDPVGRVTSASHRPPPAPPQRHPNGVTTIDHVVAVSPALERTVGSLRGAGLELRLHGCDPDEAVLRAREAGAYVMAEAADKPHGLREAYIGDPDGYIWVPDVPLR
jgi:uncharacterized glyoxalase superfamily protein PhnB